MWLLFLFVLLPVCLLVLLYFRSPSFRAKWNLFILKRPDPSVPSFSYDGKQHNTDTLVIAFQGGANLVAGINVLEWKKTLDAINVDSCFVSDWTQTWYLNTYESKKKI